MIATNESVLTDAFTDAIVALTPRLVFKGAESWKPYKRGDSGPTRTRRFRILWDAGNIQPRGAMAGHVIEHYATCRIRTDYAGEHAEQQHVIIDDFHQIGDALTMLKDSSDANGLIVVERLQPQEVFGEIDDTDVVRIDHTYRVRFMRSIRP